MAHHIDYDVGYRKWHSNLDRSGNSYFIASDAAYTCPKTACGMSLISMVSMEIAMNAVDVLLTGGAKLTIWVIPIMLLTGFLTPLPYNYWRLQVHGKSCH